MHSASFSVETYACTDRYTCEALLRGMGGGGRRNVSASDKSHVIVGGYLADRAPQQRNYSPVPGVTATMVRTHDRVSASRNYEHSDGRPSILSAQSECDIYPVFFFLNQIPCDIDSGRANNFATAAVLRGNISTGCLAHTGTSTCSPR